MLYIYYTDSLMICILNIFLDIHTVTICILYTHYIIYTQKENMYIHIYIMDPK